MDSRAVLFIALAAGFSFASWVALAAPSPPDTPGYASKLTIYLAKGAENSCGQGCDRWIAVEGSVDVEAAARVEQFLSGVKDFQRPIFFNSPGGEVRQALTIGRLLRSRKAIARIGRTVVARCDAGPQIDVVCLKMKNAGGEMEAVIDTRQAICNSACGYLFLGATTREVAPNATFGVHSGKLTIDTKATLSFRQHEQVMASLHQKAHRDTLSFVEAMGIKRDLIDLIETVPYEKMHALTRQELYRFRIDTRSFAETTWTLESGPRPFIRKLVFARKDDNDSFRIFEFMLSCEDNNKDRVRLLLVREADKSEGASRISMAMSAGSDKPLRFFAFPARKDGFDVWTATIAIDALKTWFATPIVKVGESASMQDGKAPQAIFDIETRDLERAWAQLAKSCALLPPASARATVNSWQTPSPRWPAPSAVPVLPPWRSPPITPAR